MDTETLSALRESIKHWQDNAKAETFKDASAGVDNCALCRLFYNYDCEGCPVMERTGKELCDGSPYEEAGIRLWDWRDDLKNPLIRDRFHIAAQAEVDFLKSLLPGDK